MQGGYRFEIIDGELRRRSMSTSSISCSSLLCCDSHHANRITHDDDYRIRHCPPTFTFMRRETYDLRNADAVSSRSEASAEALEKVVTTPFVSNFNALHHAISILNHLTDLNESNNKSGGAQTQGAQQQLLGPAPAALMTKSPINPQQLELLLLHSSMLVNASMRKVQVPIVLSNNISTQMNVASGQPVLDSFAPAPKGDLFAGQQNRFASTNISSLGPYPTVSSYYIEKQQPHNAPQVQSLSSASVPDNPCIWPCLARGTDDEHNRRAHFVVPHDIQHRAGLVCSSSAYYCQTNKGVQIFCFCTSICNVPAAKPCFRRRHSHNHCDVDVDLLSQEQQDATMMMGAAVLSNNLSHSNNNNNNNNNTVLDPLLLSTSTIKRKRADKQPVVSTNTTRNCISRAKICPGLEP